jgi:hypothetical protein
VRTGPLTFSTTIQPPYILLKISRRENEKDESEKDESEQDAKLAQKSGQLQPFIAAFLQECMGQLVSFGPT